MDRILKTDTCLVAALAVVADLKNIWSEGTGDLGWITSPDIDEYFQGKYKPQKAVDALNNLEGFAAQVNTASGSIKFIDNKTYWIASMRADLGELDMDFVLVFDEDKMLLAIMSDRDYADELKAIVG